MHLDGATRQPLRHPSLCEQQLAACQLLGLADVEGRDGVCAAGRVVGRESDRDER